MQLIGLLFASGILVAPIAYAQTSTYHLSQKFMAVDAEPGDLFGTLVDLDGDVAIVRSRADYNTPDIPPQTHVFESDASGQWSETGLITFSDLFQDGGYYLGQEAALDKGQIFNGQSFGANFGFLHTAVTFAKRGTVGWEREFAKKLEESDLDKLSNYRPGNRAVGRSVAISGGLALASDRTARITSEADNTRSRYGAVHFYEQAVDGQWSWGGLITPEEEPSDGFAAFGGAVALDGNTAAITTKSHRPSQNGKVYFFERELTGDWKQTARFVFGEDDEDEFVPRMIQVSGDFAVARGFTSSKTIVFSRKSSPGEDGNLWEETLRLSGEDALGRTIAIDGNLLAMTAFGSDEEPSEVRLFRHDAIEGWSLLETIVSPDPTYRQVFGSSLALDNGRLLIGASNNSNRFDLARNDPGAAFLFVPVPEPNTAALLVLGLLTVARRNGRR